MQFVFPQAELLVKQSLQQLLTSCSPVLLLLRRDKALLHERQPGAYASLLSLRICKLRPHDELHEPLEVHGHTS